MAEIQVNIELHVCMGINSCKGMGYGGTNDCAGIGDCATAVGHPCHTLNECKGQGACGIFGTTEEFCHPGENDCRYQGSCGVPILDARFFSQGPNKGRSVWQLARKRFEEKRNAEGKPFGPPPAGIYGPSNDFINKLKNQPAGKDNSSCGNSGSRSCSYIADPIARKAAADARVLAVNKESAAKMDETLATCKNVK
jgi:hypothetical protein